MRTNPLPPLVCAYRPRARDFSPPASRPGRINLFADTFGRGARGRQLTLPRGLLVLAMYRPDVEGTLRVWAHDDPWRAQLVSQAAVRFDTRPNPLNVAFAFRNSADTRLAEKDVAPSDYARYLGGKPENHIRRETYRGGVFISTGIPETESEGPGRIWACGSVTEELWHFESDAIFRMELLGGILRMMGVPPASVAGLARTVTESLDIGRSVADHRRLFSVRYQHPENAVDISWSPLQLAKVKGTVYRIGDQQVGICANSRETDRFQLVGSVVVATLPRSKQLEILRSPLRGHLALPVFANLTELRRGGVNAFSWFVPEPLPS